LNRITKTITITSVSIVLFLAACSSQKDTVANRKLQNLSARYNLIFNANNLLDEYLVKLNEETPKDFSATLPLFIAPIQADAQNTSKPEKELDEIAQKARTVIAEKGFSNYLDEAYLLLGKTYFYQGKYYNASEYFDYVARSYKKNHSIYLAALNWKARSLMQINELSRVAKILDTVKIELDSVKRNKAEAWATLAQMNINQNATEKAIIELNNALKQVKNKTDKLNWTYTLAQLYEIQKDYANSLSNYAKVEKSNADFELYFNAKLSSVRINERISPNNFNKKAVLGKMLKDDKNFDFRDQILYELASDYAEQKDYKQAEQYYQKSARASTKNKTQKALSFLQIADINFNHYADYLTAKLYYDSAANELPKNHLLYASTNNKAKNLSYLQKRYENIALQDTLQKIARLKESERLPALHHYFEQIASQQAPKEGPENEADRGANTNQNPRTRTSSGGSFYFANIDALSRGYNEFKRKWGDRKLAPNWRIAKQKDPNKASDNDPFDSNSLAMSNPDEVPKEAPNVTNPAQSYLDSLPNTPERLEQSNQKIIAAYLDLGSFYQQVLKDKPQTIKTYQTLLNRFPNISALDRVYYSLYLAYQGTDQQKSNDYKNLVLKKYPESVFAKTILNPDFSVKQNELELKLSRAYETTFEKYQQQQYNEVQKEAKSINQRFPGNKLAAQFDYLSALAQGHTAGIEPSLSTFKTISSQYKNDALIKPLVDQHIAFIQKNWAVLKNQKFAIMPIDSNDIPFKDQIRLTAPIVANVLDPNNKAIARIPAATKPMVAVNTSPTKTAVPEKPVVAKIEPVKQTDSLAKPIEAKTLVAANKLTEPEKPSAAKITKTDSIKTAVNKEVPKPKAVKDHLFDNNLSKTYYYVIAVNTYEVSVSSSRFGIGQFNRVNYSGANLRHQLSELEKDQLILVGDFLSPADALAYQEKIATQLRNLIKIPTANYTTFVISKENLAKIIDRSTLERYKAYIKDNEL
jgi:TolA-binding protein